MDHFMLVKITDDIKNYECFYEETKLFCLCERMFLDLFQTV